LWHIGNELKRAGVNKPHKYGWAIQRDTKGIIKRPTIFRGFKVRLIWPSIDDLKADLGDIKGLSCFIEMLPLIDPKQQTKYKVPNNIVVQIYKHASSDSPQDFKAYINNVKQSFATGRLTKKVDRFRHLAELNQYVTIFSHMYNYLSDLLKSDTPDLRNEFRNNMPLKMRQALSNMCISMTTKANYRYYRKMENVDFSANQDYNNLFKFFKSILDTRADTERARIRKLISSDYFAGMSDMLCSIDDEIKVADYKMRERISLDM